MSSKQSLTLATALLALAALVTWTSSRLTWMSVTLSDFLSPERPVDIAGGTWAVAVGWIWPLVLLAAIPAAIAVRGWARAGVAVIIGLVAVGIAFPASQVLGREPDVAYIELVLDLPQKDVVVVADRAIAGPMVAIVGAVIAVAAATFVLRNARGSGLGMKYTSPAVRRAELEKKAFERAAAADASERDIWDALDGGGDPTDKDGTDPTDKGGGDEGGSTGRADDRG